MAYTIMISEVQRKLLHALLEANHAVIREHQRNYFTGEFEHSNLDPDILCGMFHDLSCLSDDVVHDFCL